MGQIVEMPSRKFTSPFCTSVRASAGYSRTRLRASSPPVAPLGLERASVAGHLAGALAGRSPPRVALRDRPATSFGSAVVGLTTLAHVDRQLRGQPPLHRINPMLEGEVLMQICFTLWLTPARSA